MLVPLVPLDDVVLPYTSVRIDLEERAEGFARWVASSFSERKAGIVLAFVRTEAGGSVYHPVGLFARVVEVSMSSSSSNGPPRGYCVVETHHRVAIPADAVRDVDQMVEPTPFKNALGNSRNVKRLMARLEAMLDTSNATLKRLLRDVDPHLDVLASVVFAGADRSEKLQLLEASTEKRLEMVVSMLERRQGRQRQHQRRPTDERDAKYLAMLEERGANEETVNAVKSELKKLHAMNEMHPFYSGQVAYLDVVSSIPWNVIKAKRDLSLLEVRSVLDAHHHGMGDVKKRIVEYVAVMKMLRRVQASAALQASAASPPPILLLVGPPGTGKTSIAKSIAACLDKKFERVSLGGVSDEAEIRGHRRTYIGSFPGRVVNALRQSGVSDPLILVDEIDKVSRDGRSRGDVSSALLELLDPEQNERFKDHYVNLPVDVSRVTFVCTANTLDTVPAPLIDRCEVVELSSYTTAEKRVIARKHLLPDVLKQCGLDEADLRLDDEGLDALINEYTREAGVRGLRQVLDAVARHVVVSRLTLPSVGARTSSGAVSVDDLHAILGPPKYSHPKDDLYSGSSPSGATTGATTGATSTPSAVGYAVGLVWTPVGGRCLVVECINVPVGDKTSVAPPTLVLTGSAGDVLQESAKIVLSWLRANIQRLSPSASLSEATSIHLHLPAGATKKDGGYRPRPRPRGTHPNPHPHAHALYAPRSYARPERRSHDAVRHILARHGQARQTRHRLHRRALAPRPRPARRRHQGEAHRSPRLGHPHRRHPKRNLLEANKCIADEHMHDMRLVPVSFADDVLAEAFDGPPLAENTRDDDTHTPWLSSSKL